MRRTKTPEVLFQTFVLSGLSISKINRLIGVFYLIFRLY